MQPHFIFVAPDLFSIYTEFVRGLKEVGAMVTAIGHTPKARLDSRLKRYLDSYLQVGSLLDEGQLLEAARAATKVRPVDFMETGDESMVLAVAKVRAALNIPGLSVRTVTLCRDKPAMKEALREAGVPCAASVGTANLRELQDFAEREGFPLILKPRSALGALGTHRVESMAELEQRAGELGLRQGQSIAAEEFVEGHEGFYDTLSVKGEVIHDFISHYYPNVLDALSDRRVSPQIAATNRVSLSSYDELKAMGKKVIKALGIGTSATHMEWFFGPKGLKFSEIGVRPPGEKIWDLYCAGNDMDLYREWAMIHVHGQPGSQPSRRLATGSVQVRPDRDGIIAGYRGIQEVLRIIRPYLFDHELPKRGTPTTPIYKGYLNNVWFRLRHPDYDELLRLMDFVGQNLKVVARGV